MATSHLTIEKRAIYRVKQENSQIQKNGALKLCELSRIDPSRPCGIDEVRRLQDALPEYRVCVFTDKKGKDRIFIGSYTTNRKNIYLLLHNDHFSAILQPYQAFEYHFQCERCVFFYSHVGDHRCEDTVWRTPNPV